MLTPDEPDVPERERERERERDGERDTHREKRTETNRQTDRHIHTHTYTHTHTHTHRFIDTEIQYGHRADKDTHMSTFWDRTKQKQRFELA